MLVQACVSALPRMWPAFGCVDCVRYIFHKGKTPYLRLFACLSFVCFIETNKRYADTIYKTSALAYNIVEKLYTNSAKQKGNKE